MAQVANIAINDGKTPTAVSHVYVPFESGLNSAYRRTGVANQPAVAMETIKTSFKSSPSANGVNKVDVELVIPVLEQVTGGTSSGYVAAPALAYELRFKGTFFLHQRSETAGRTDLRVLVSNLLKDAQVIDLIDNLNPAY